MSTGYRRIAVAPIAGALGAEISGVDLSQPLDAETVAEIRRAFNDFLVVYFHGQDISPAQQCDVARLFGPLTRHPFIRTLPDHPEVAPLIRDADDRSGALNFGGLWHMDVTFMECPPLGSMLYAVDPPPFGGDTMFSNMYLAYDALSPGMKALADRLIVIHSAAVSYDPHRGADDPKTSKVAQKGMAFDIGEDVTAEVEHPLVRIHPETGKRLLFVNAGYQVRFKDMTEAESKPLFDFFNAHASRPEFTCRFRYAKGTLGFWDNRCTQHFALDDYRGYRREMHRVQIGGDRPYGPAMPKDERPPMATE